MSHKEILKLLFPVEMGGDFDTDIGVEGKHLDAAETRCGDLLREIFPDRAAESLLDWERVCALTPEAGEVPESRRQKILAKIRERGGLSIAYFMGLADTMDFDISIEELQPNVEGHGPESIFIWRVHVMNQPVYYFEAGVSEAGQELCSWNNQGGLEGLFQELKPAHSQLIFAYV